MTATAAEPQRQLMLVGGGHAHLFVLEHFARSRVPDLRISLVSKGRFTPYSGMLPGHVAGLYPREAMHIDLARLAARCGATLLIEEAVALDLDERRVRLAGGASLSYDVLSLDVGIMPDLSEVAGAGEHGVAVKPIGDFLGKWDRLLAEAMRPDGPRRIAVVGGGLAGLCLVFAAAGRLRREAARAGLDPAAFAFTLVSAAAPAELNPGMGRAVARALRRQGIRVFRGAKATGIGPPGVTLATGEVVPADRVLLSTQAMAPAPIAASALAKAPGGFVAVEPTLRSVSHPDVFAAGDCATVLAYPRPKAGVFAVRQGPALARNLRRHLRGEPLEEHRPQKKHLVLLGTGDGRAIGGRGRWLAFEGRVAWWLKDWLDRRFVRRFS